MNDLVFYGGLNGVVFGNQQFTVRNLTFYNAVTAIDQIWDWGWTYTGISINNCTTGLNMAGGGTTGQSTGSVTFLDSSFTNTKVAIATAHNASSFPATAGSLILDNIVLTNTPVVVQGPQGTVLKGGSLTISGWGEGHEYTANYQKKNFQSSITKFSRPSSLTKNGQYYARSKPQYQASPLSQFVSVRTAGAKGEDSPTTQPRSTVFSRVLLQPVRLCFSMLGPTKSLRPSPFPLDRRLWASHSQSSWEPARSSPASRVRNQSLPSEPQGRAE
jgi:glucan 1,3-beta-glucosidase